MPSSKNPPIRVGKTKRGWKPWVVDEDVVERTMPDGSTLLLWSQIPPPTPYRIIKTVVASNFGEPPRRMVAGTIDYLIDDFAREAAAEGWVLPMNNVINKFRLWRKDSGTENEAESLPGYNHAWIPWVVESRLIVMIERTLHDGSKLILDSRVYAPTLHRVLKDFSGASAEDRVSRNYTAGEIVYVWNGLARIAVRHGWAEPIEDQDRHKVESAGIASASLLEYPQRKVSTRSTDTESAVWPALACEASPYSSTGPTMNSSSE